MNDHPMLTMVAVPAIVFPAGWDLAPSLMKARFILDESWFHLLK
jgi:hypothetical protein